MNKQLKTILTALLIMLATAFTGRAWDMQLGTNLPPVTFHGFVSQGYLLSSTYNYLADNTTEGSWEFFEAGVSASFNPFPHTRIALQGFAFTVGDVGQYDPMLDYGLIEYTFNDELGVRGGRVLRPNGIYNEIQDVDLARTCVLLPQGIYDARWRDFSCALDGGDIFGNVSLKKAGSLSYEVYGGVANLADNGGVAAQVRNSLPPGGTLDELSQPALVGGQLWWNTPLDGMRAGFSYAHAFGVDFNVVQPVPPIGTAFPNTSIDVDNVRASLEYLWKGWTFQSEYNQMFQNSHLDTTYTFMPATHTKTYTQADSWYVLAAYRLNKWAELGSYYTEAFNNIHQRDNSLLYQKDLALSLRLDPTSWWIFKIEGHYIRGTGLLYDNANNPNQDSDGWFMLALKTTFSF